MSTQCRFIYSTLDVQKKTLSLAHTHFICICIFMVFVVVVAIIRYISLVVGLVNIFNISKFTWLFGSTHPLFKPSESTQTPKPKKEKSENKYDELSHWFTILFNDFCDDKKGSSIHFSHIVCELCFGGKKIILSIPKIHLRIAVCISSRVAKTSKNWKLFLCQMRIKI